MLRPFSPSLEPFSFGFGVPISVARGLPVGGGCCVGLLRLNAAGAEGSGSRCGCGGTRSEMLSGFNTNYRHRGVLFHVQSEDSGVTNPHVITHLFHGGNILASVKVQYAEHLASPDLEAVVKSLMEQSHKSMLQRLRGGEYDDLIVERLGADAFSGAGGDDGLTDPNDTAADTLPPVEPDTRPTMAEPTRILEPVPEEATNERLKGAFGERVVSQKPLDEVVPEYLVENARKRKRRSK